MKADLHIHSTVSDGTDTIEEIIKKAVVRGLDCIAITDHDTMSHLSQIPKETPLRVLGGVEISAHHKETKLRAHILGYNIQKPEIITRLTQPILEARDANSRKQVHILQGQGFKIDIEDLPKADGKYLYKQHIMDHLTFTGQAEEMFGRFYKSTFKNGGICDFDIDYIDVFEAVRAIKEAGGLAVLAHPGQQQNFWLVSELVEAGLDGIERNHHTNSLEDQKRIEVLSEEYGLFMTGGSDYHGRYEPQPFDIGSFLSHESGVAAICQS